MQAQTTITSPAGEYYLRGVMETASGFKLNEDHTFEFFFSYGALDRGGAGSWEQLGDSIVFNSKAGPSRDYTLVESARKEQKGMTIRITGGNDYINQYVHAIVRSGSREQQGKANQDGLMELPGESADTIELIFELCPDKSSLFHITYKAHNYFEFRLEPSISDVIFTNFKIGLMEGEMKGPHPLAEGETFVYEKAKR